MPFAFLAYYNTQTESLLSFVDMPGSWGLVGVKKASMPGWVDDHDLIHIKKTRGLNCSYSILYIVLLMFIEYATPANHDLLKSHGPMDHPWFQRSRG